MYSVSLGAVDTYVTGKVLSAAAAAANLAAVEFFAAADLSDGCLGLDSTAIAPDIGIQAALRCLWPGPD